MSPSCHFFGLNLLPIPLFKKYAMKFIIGSKSLITSVFIFQARLHMQIILKFYFA